jgi:hypothetical protein
MNKYTQNEYFTIPVLSINLKTFFLSESIKEKARDLFYLRAAGKAKRTKFTSRPILGVFKDLGRIGQSCSFNLRFLHIRVQRNSSVM